MTKLRAPIRTLACTLLVAAAFSPSLFAQQAAAPLPDAPSALVSSSADADGDQSTQAGQTQQDAPPKRLLGIIPNFRSVRTSVRLPKQTVKDKFVAASQDTFDYSAGALAVTVAFYSYERNSTPEFGSGGVGFSRYLWHSVADQSVENYFVEFIVPVIAKEDTRFYTLGSGGFKKRAGFALSRVFVTRSDDDKRTFNAGEVVGAAVSSAVSGLYYPRAEYTFTNFAERYGQNVGIDALAYFVKEFEPEISHAFSRHKQTN